QVVAKTLQCVHSGAVKIASNPSRGKSKPVNSLPLDEAVQSSDVAVISGIELSVVMPCLNEAETLATCIRKAQAAFQRADIAGEVIVADNGSDDGSQAIATDLGARVVAVSAKGYGNALMGGIAAAKGRYVVMGDSDDSYDFGDIPRFLEELRKGSDLV